MAEKPCPDSFDANYHAELLMLYEIGIAMRSTLRLDEILYIILTSVTAREGLKFNRAMVFLANEKENVLEGRMGIGPESGDDAQRIWGYIQQERKTLDELLKAHKEFDRSADSHLNHLVRGIRLPIVPTSGVLAETVLTRRPLEIITEESRKQVDVRDPVITLFNMEKFVTVPLMAKDRVVGVMLVDNFYTKNPITKDDLWRLTMFANQAGLAIENSQEFERTLYLSNTDRLTGLWNYGYFQHQLNEEIKRAARFNRQLSLLMLDIDHFKKVNDSFGHVAGDLILQDLARIMRNTCREVDLVSRYGGEEFAVILPEASKEQAHTSAERIRRNVGENDFFPMDLKYPVRITVSVGVTSFPQDSQTKDALILCADKALYAAKKTGRNRVCMYGRELMHL